MRYLVAFVLITCTGCHGNSGDRGVPCTPQLSNPRLWTVDKLTLPQQRDDFAYDLNGDGKIENQLANVVGTLALDDFDAQSYVDAALAAGMDPMQLETFGGAATLSETLPDQAPGVFCATLNGTQLTSQDTWEAAAPVDMTMSLAFVDNLTVHITGAHLQLTISGDHVDGQLNGAIRKEEIATVLDPGVADMMNKKIAGDPTSGQTQTLLNVFDNGGDVPPGQNGPCGNSCQNADGSCGVAHNGHIKACEVSTNAIAKNVLAPDVQLFAADGTTYQPNAGACSPDKSCDSMSIGVAFSARAAQP